MAQITEQILDTMIAAGNTDITFYEISLRYEINIQGLDFKRGQTGLGNYRHIFACGSWWHIRIKTTTNIVDSCLESMIANYFNEKGIN
jgi:hypothetical protein